MEHSISYYKRLLIENIEEKKLSAKQQKLAALTSPKNKINSGDLKAARKGQTLQKEDLSKDKIMAQIMGPDHFLAQTPEIEWKKWDHAAYDGIMNMAKDGYRPVMRTQPTLNTDLDDKNDNESGMSEAQDHEVSMANNSLESIVKAAMDLKSKLGKEEKDIPAWIQDHITNAANYISQAAENYHEYAAEENMDQEVEDEEMPSIPKNTDDTSLQGMMEELFENKRKVKRKK